MGVKSLISSKIAVEGVDHGVPLGDFAHEGVPERLLPSRFKCGHVNALLFDPRVIAQVEDPFSVAPTGLQKMIRCCAQDVATIGLGVRCCVQTTTRLLGQDFFLFRTVQF